MLSITVCFIWSAVPAQQKAFVPDLSKVNDTSMWIVHNRSATFNDGELTLNGKEGDGLVLLKNYSFSNGKIELDIKGKDDRGRSFVGIAFHAINDSTYDAIYFRAFNFRNPERKGHSLQYISMPSFDWEKLRIENYGEYENSISAAPNPNDWFHVTIEVKYPFVKVYVNNAKDPSLQISVLSPHKKGKLGFFVGNNSEGRFKNLKIYAE